MSDSPNETESTGFGGVKVTDRRHGARHDEPAEPAPEQPAGDQKRSVPLPPVDFTTFILSLASNAMIQLGIAPDPETGKTSTEPELARQTIDLLGMLREKTRGNLTDEESRFFDAMLYDLRVRFVEATSAKRP